MLRVLLLLTICIPLTATPKVFEMDPNESVFALITHKKGVFSSMAHNHFILATPSEMQVQQKADDTWAMSFKFTVNDLKVDPYAVAKAHYPELEKMQLLNEPYGELGDKDRQKIRKSMLDKGQLDASNFATITAELVQLKAHSETIGSVAFSHMLEMDVTIKGKTQRVAFAANLHMAEDGSVQLQALGKSRFSDFGIEPYSAFFGAVANSDAIEFYVVMQLKAAN